jgi:hypothetical protein
VALKLIIFEDKSGWKCKVLDQRESIIYASEQPNLSAASARGEGKMFLRTLDPSLQYTIAEEPMSRGNGVPTIPHPAAGP